MNINNIKNRIYDWDNYQWKISMASKRSLEIYRQFKERPAEAKWMKNHQKYSTMLMARGNSLDLGWRGMNPTRDRKCNLCGSPEETLHHFIFTCEALNCIRDKYVNFHQLNLNKILLFEEDQVHNHEFYIDLINKLWNHRKTKLSNLDN